MVVGGLGKIWAMIIFGIRCKEILPAILIATNTPNSSVLLAAYRLGPVLTRNEKNRN